MAKFIDGAHRGCQCSVWAARGAEHCYPENMLNGTSNPILDNLNCFVAKCATAKTTFKILFPFIQVISSVLQISFAMTHLGAANNLRNLASMAAGLKRAFFYVITWFYFMISLSISLILSTYLANVKENGLFQLLAFFTVLRLILPEATRARKYIAPGLLRVCTVLFPLIAHLPFYILLYTQLSSEDSICKVHDRNRITLQVRQNRTFGRNIVTYATTAKEVEETLVTQLSHMEFFPVNLNSLPKYQSTVG